jgi:hypothetical protein
MATAETIEIKHLVLVLDPDEADALTAVLCRVGGSPLKSARQHTQSIVVALEEAGYDWHETRSKARGSLAFEDYAEENMNV